MEEYEAVVRFQALQAFGVSVDAVCPGKKFGDICPTASYYDGLVMPEGRSPEYLAVDAYFVELVRKFSDSKKPIALLLVMAAADSIRGRKCTGFPPVRPVLVATGAHWVEPEIMSSCVVDGDIVSGVTYEGNPEFIRLFAKALGGNITGSDRRILFLCRDFMKDYEITVPFLSLQALGCHFHAVCPKRKSGDTCTTAVHDFEGDQTYSEKPGHNFVLTIDFDTLDVSSYEALVIHGGRAPEYMAMDENVIAVVKQIMESGKPVASLCHSALKQILAAAGVLQGKKCTVYPAVELNVILSGATWLEPDLIDSFFTDGNLVAAAGSGRAIQSSSLS